MSEIWKTIEGYPSYMVSNMGRVKRIEGYDSAGHYRNEKMLSPKTNRYGYCEYALCKDGQMLRKWDSATEAEEELNLHHQSISKCCKGSYGVKTVGGYVWKYYEKETYLIGIMNNNFKYAPQKKTPIDLSLQGKNKSNYMRR